MILHYIMSCYNIECYVRDAGRRPSRHLAVALAAAVGGRLPLAARKLVVIYIYIYIYIYILCLSHLGEARKTSNDDNYKDNPTTTTNNNNHYYYYY